MTNLSPDLVRLGDALQRAAEADLALARAPQHAPSRGRPRRLALVLAALAVVIPGGALAASTLIGTDDVERGLPAGTRFMIGTQPTCTVVRQDVEYHCVLGREPRGEIAPGQFKGTVEPIVDASRHVNGGCRAQSADGREWQCYIGEAAVQQRIISRDFLGEPTQGPGRG
jgi:hypothetical protein